MWISLRSKKKSTFDGTAHLLLQTVAFYKVLHSEVARGGILPTVTKGHVDSL